VVVRIAHLNLGHRYVWGAEGPNVFDCSGLVQWAYKKAGRSVVRTADEQYHAARRIPRSHMKPGDLVFYHNSGHWGHVFHVGIWISPGMTIAAVDPAEGVRYQSINYSDASFGSFTHA
jgi:cell wall-associated NlpC family hydrolase